MVYFQCFKHVFLSCFMHIHTVCVYKWVKTKITNLPTLFFSSPLRQYDNFFLAIFQAVAMPIFVLLA